jgi:hypothetical protein
MDNEPASLKKEASVVESVHSMKGSEKKSLKDEEAVDTNHPEATVGMLSMMAGGAASVVGLFYNNETPAGEEPPKENEEE